MNLRHVEVTEEDEAVVDKRRIPVADAHREGLIRALQEQRP